MDLGEEFDRRPNLVRLAGQLGISVGYWDGTRTHRVPPMATVQKICAAMGFPAETEAQADTSSRMLMASDVSQQVQMWFTDAPEGVCVFFHDLPEFLRLREEITGNTLSWDFTVRAQKLDLPQGAPLDDPAVTIRLTEGTTAYFGNLAWGYYQISIDECPDFPCIQLAVAPPACLRPEELGQGGHDVRFWGLWSNLYTVRSQGGAGIGNLSDLRKLLSWTARAGGQFVGLNPLHALSPLGHQDSPYSPISRMFLDPIYMDPFAVPEFADKPGRLEASGKGKSELDALRAADELDRPRILKTLVPIWKATFSAFLAHATPERIAAFEDFCARRDPELTGFAMYCALELEFSTSKKGPLKKGSRVEPGGTAFTLGPKPIGTETARPRRTTSRRILMRSACSSSCSLNAIASWPNSSGTPAVGDWAQRWPSVCIETWRWATPPRG